MILRDSEEVETESESDYADIPELEDVDEENTTEYAVNSKLLVTRRALSAQIKADDLERQQENIFHTQYHVNGKLCERWRSINLAPLTPAQVYDDQIQLKNKEARVRELGKRREISKESLLNFREHNTSLPNLAISLLQEFEDVFPEDVPSGLPPIKGIEHQIDFIPGVVILNRPTYRSNPEESKELQRQVEELMSKGYKDGTWRMCVDCRAINNIT
ncbi:uncharacterized protein LOC111385444, partial [Olea europaea var. sylvestris]|uniref:uncharacterized protein LOC111385444 n=1 Tax=Olea europaea var. sylvestris TaxID=158386 RepID=UPI000C1D52F1